MSKELIHAIAEVTFLFLDLIPIPEAEIDGKFGLKPLFFVDSSSSCPNEEQDMPCPHVQPEVQLASADDGCSDDDDGEFICPQLREELPGNSLTV